MSEASAYVAYDGFSAKIDKVDAVYSLSWNDSVANEWVEYFPSLSLAVARLSNLIRCGEGEDNFFAKSAEEFAKEFNQLLQENVSS